MTEHKPADHAARAAALDPHASCIVQAPAGSGKTGLLTQRFLRLLAQAEHPEEIVAITFTRKAAAEMHERILAAMRAASEGAAPGEGENARLTRALAEAALAADAAHEWNLLENPARLRVTTIDAFNAMLTRQLPLRSGFGQAPGVAERSETHCRIAAQRLLSGVDRDDAAGEAMRVLLSHLDNRFDDLTELLAMMLLRRDLWLRHMEFSGLNRATLEAALAHEIEQVLEALQAEFPLHGHDAIPPLAQRCADYLATSVSDRIGTMNALAQMTLPGAQAACLSDWQRYAEFLLTSGGELRKPRGLNATYGFPAASERGIDAAEKAARDAHKSAMGEVLAALEERPLAVTLLRRTLQLPAAQYSDAQWRVLEALNALMPFAVLALQEVFRDSGEVDFPELAMRARAALGDADAPTDLALRLDYQIRHLLVDEFQDTSHAQIDLLLRLTREWQDGDGRTLFLVGDPMQSIYQFREAEVGHFLAVRDGGLGALPLRSLRLSANFRSQAGIVEWVNAAFAHIFPPRDDIATGAIAFEPSTPAHDALPGMPVRIHAFEQYENEAEAQRVVELLREALADPDNRDVAILVRGRSHLAAVLPLLRANGIPFRAVELDALGALPLIQDLYALTRALTNAADSTAVLSVLRAPWCGLSLTELHALANAPGAWPDEMSKLPEPSRTACRRVMAALQAAEAARGHVSLRERVERAWYALGGPAAARDPADHENARLFFELLQQLEQAGELNDVNELPPNLDRLYAAPDPGAGDAVQVMTLHKAKGLQFDTVIIPALDQVTGRKDRLLFHWLERPQAEGGEHLLLGPVKSREDEEGGVIYRFIERLKEEKESLERARLLYVGITRAKRRVHLLGKARRSVVNGVPELAPPRAGSLLELLWSLEEVREAFEALPPPAEKPERRQRIRNLNLLKKLPANWQPPELPSAPAVVVRAQGIGSEAARLVYEWAGDRVRLVGTVVHRVLERMARDGMRHWNRERLESLPLAGQLSALGLPESECAAAAAEARHILLRALESRHARWILDAHENARNEWALGGIDGGERVNVIIDRSFVDADGVRWIVDYKTSKHEGGDLEGFLAEQQERYRGQLERYARLVRQLDGRPLRLALYFPLQDALRAWEPELG